MNNKFLVSTAFILLILSNYSFAQSTKFSDPIVSDSVIFEEKDGIVSVEAEYFFKQSLTDIREWYRTSKNESPQVGRDADPPHCFKASNNAYIEILPDERITHSDEIVRGTNFSGQPGALAIVHYKVKINNPGRYYVWVRAYSTGSEDNGVHVGFNGKWPESGKRMQWCKGKNRWTWESMQRTKEEHCGIPHAIFLDLEKAGIYNIQFSMREDGFEMDKFILVADKNYIPKKEGPKTLVSNGDLPAPFPAVLPVHPVSYFNYISKSLPEVKSIPSQSFDYKETNFYKNGKNWLAINPKKHKEAKTSTTFNFDSGNYDIIFVGVGENDGRSKFSVFINDKELGTYAPKLTDKLWVEGKEFNAFWENVKLKKGDKITVMGKVDTDGNEWTRARWAGIVFTPAGLGRAIEASPSTDYFIK